MSMNQNLATRAQVGESKLGNLWIDIKRIFRILGAANISTIMVLLSVVLLFGQDQVKDAIIALGNFGSTHHFIIFGFIGMFWAFLVWYWARVFFYVQFHKEEDLRGYEKEIIEHTPHALGAISLLAIAAAFLIQAPLCQLPGKANPIRIIGIVFLVLTVAFLIIVNFWKKLIPDELSSDPSKSIVGDIVPIKNLRPLTRNILFLTTIIAVILLVLLIIFPIHMTIYLGDGVTILIACFCLWLPLFYWVRYGSLKLSFPLFLILFILIAFFSLFNGNKNVRITEHASDTRMDLSTFYQEWDKKVTPLPNPDGRKPMVIVLSEGGGIRAAYWSAKLMAHIQTEYPRFRDYLFGISGVSGGSFGATVFDSLLKCNVSDKPDKKNKYNESDLEKTTRDVVGKDYLSPTIACMFTREIVQLFLPFPISSFDRAKVFEDTWEYQWKKQLEQAPVFGDPFLSLWNHNTPTGVEKSIPPLFINSTEVEDGYPVLVSNLKINSKDDLSGSPDLDNTGKDFVMPKDFYTDILKDGKTSDVRISTAALLSARFTYVSPAGTIINQRGKTIGLVDGGYFENTGANTAYRVLLSLKSWNEQQQQQKKANSNLQPLSTDDLDQASIFRSKVKPVIIYLHNGTETANGKTSGKTMFYQLLAPPLTLLQVRDAHTNNALFRLEEFVKLYDGDFILFSLLGDKKSPVTLPLGWALSKKAQEQIDSRVKDKDTEEHIKELGEYLK